MSSMRLIILAVAGVAAILAAFLVRNMASQPVAITSAAPVERIVEVEVSQQKVLVASGDLRMGMLITPDELQWADWPEASINPAYFTQDIRPTAIEDLTGSVVINVIDYHVSNEQLAECITIFNHGDIEHRHRITRLRVNPLQQGNVALDAGNARRDQRLL